MFISSEEEEPKPTTGIVTGSEYFNFKNPTAFRKQIYADIRQKTILRMEMVRDNSGFNTFWP
jgi:hypothetical protein